VPGGAEFGREGDDHHEGCLHRNQGDQSRLQCAGKHREIIGQRTPADDAGIVSVAEQVLDVGDGKIFSHGRTPKNDVYVRFNRGCRDLTYESSGGARSW
jgi:hypothetical protein